MAWQVLFLHEFERDLAAFPDAEAARVRADLLAQFQAPFKEDRLGRLLASGASTPALDRLAGSRYPPSIRLRVLRDLRATAWCFPAQRHVVMVHLFHKSRDPEHRRALGTHDARLARYFEDLRTFVDKKRG